MRTFFTKTTSLSFLAVAMMLWLSGVCTSAAGSTNAPHRLPATIRPIDQTVVLKVDPNQPGYSGSTEIALELRESVTAIRLHSEGIQIDEVRLLRDGSDEIDVSWTFEVEGPLAGAALEVRAAEPLPGGRYSVAIEFTNEFNGNAVGLYRTDFAGDGYAFTQFEADDAREAFPCFDEPSFKIPFEMIVEVPTGQTVVSNTPIAKSTSGEGWDRFEFLPTKPLPTYLLTIAVGPFDYVEMPGLGVPARIYTPRGQSHLAQIAVETTPPLLQALEEYFDSPYPFAKLDYIAVPEYWPGAMEHPGAITYADGLLLQDPERTNLRRRRGMANTITHELAHQWFGNYVTMEWWNDLWLNESFADWLADKITDQVYPEFEIGVESEIDAQRVYATDARATTRPIRKPVTSTGNLLQGLGVAYNKGKAVLRTFENWIGPEEFRKGVVDYLDANAWGNATADDLWEAIAARANPAAAEALASFVEQAGFPIVRVEILDEGLVRLRQERYRNRGSDSPAQLWQIPVLLKYPLGDGVAERTVFLTSAEQTIKLEARPDWILPKSGGASYYRWIVAPEVMQNLYGLNPNLLDVRERIDLLANAAGLFDAGQMTGDLYLEILAGFAEDPDPRVMSYLIERLGRFRDQFVTPAMVGDFSVFVRRLLRPTWDRIGPEPRQDENLRITLLRPRLFTWLGRDGHDSEVRKAARTYVDIMTVPDLRGNGGEEAGGDSGSGVPQSLIPSAVGVAAATGDAELFDRYVAEFVEAKDPGRRQLYLRSLASFDDPELFERALDVCLNHPAVRSNEVMTVQRRANYPDAKLDASYNWFERNYDEIKQRIPGIYLSMLPRTADGCNVDRLERAKEFFSFTDHQVPGTLEELGMLEERVLVCRDLRAEEGEAIAQYLARSTEVR